MKHNGVAIIGIYDSCYYWECKLPEGENFSRYDFDKHQKIYNGDFYTALKNAIIAEDDEQIAKVIRQEYGNIITVYIVNNGEIIEK